MGMDLSKDVCRRAFEPVDQVPSEGAVLIIKSGSACSSFVVARGRDNHGVFADDRPLKPHRGAVVAALDVIAVAHSGAVTTIQNHDGLLHRSVFDERDDSVHTDAALILSDEFVAVRCSATV